MSMYNEQVLRSELDYKLERAQGRESTWARTEGRRGTVLRRRWRKAGTTDQADT